MAFNALRSTFRRDQAMPAALADGSPVEFAPTAAGASANGGIDAAAFGCPTCGRTLARGARRCAGCGQRLLLDVPLNRAVKLAGSGAAAGVLVGAMLMSVIAPVRPAVTATQDPGADAGTVGTGSAVALEIPTAVAAALRGTTAINGRLAAESVPLAEALAAKSFKSSDVVKVLRRMSIDTRAGAGMIRTFSGWPEAAAQQAALAAFYADLGAQIDTGLSASVKSGAAYRKTASTILETLGRIPAIDADARALAAKGSLELMPITIPDELQ